MEAWYFMAKTTERSVAPAKNGHPETPKSWVQIHGLVIPETLKIRPFHPTWLDWELNQQMGPKGCSVCRSPLPQRNILQWGTLTLTLDHLLEWTATHGDWRAKPRPTPNCPLSGGGLRAQTQTQRITSRWLESLSVDWNIEAPACDWCPDHTAPTPYGPSWRTSCWVLFSAPKI